jgi:serine/threonine-protein kinase
MPNARRTAAAVVLLVLAASLAGALLLKHYGVGTPALALCGEGQASGCDVVNQSAYAKVFGVPLAAIGLVFYIALAGGLALSLFAAEAARTAAARAALLLLALSLAVDLILLGVQAVKLEAYCTLCLLTYALGAGAFALLLPDRRAALAPLSAGEGRLVVAGALIAGVSTAAAAATFQAALSGRPAAPVFAAAAPAPAASASAGGAESQAEAQRLQAILDDPQKLERYYSDKAVKDFEQAKVESFDLAGAPSKGPADAPLKIVEFSDFLCPFCKQLADWLKAAVLPQLGNRVVVYYKQFPLDTACNDTLKQQVHPGACAIALGGVCAAEQNRFWPYHDVVFAKLGSLKTRADAQRAAGDAGLDAGALGACMDKPATAERLRAQVREGSAAGVSGTPVVFLNGKRVSNLNYLAAIIEKELARLGLPPLSPPKPAR